MPIPANAVRSLDTGRALRLRVVPGVCSAQGTRHDTNEGCRYISPNPGLFVVANGEGNGVTCVVFLVLSVVGIEAPSSQATLWRRIKDWVKRPS